MKQLMIPEGKKILIIAPHPDDEIFCCSGILMNHAEWCDVVLLTYGERGNPRWSKRKTAEVRKEEFRNVMKCLNIHKYIELKLPDGKVKENSLILCKIPFERYDYIFLPNRYDSHNDHSCIYSVVNKEVRKRKLKTNLFEYEMWGMLCKPSHYVDITDKIDKKKDLMMLYKSQEMYIDYCDRILALDYFRAIEVPSKSYVECFYNKSEKTEFNMSLWINKKIEYWLLNKE